MSSENKPEITVKLLEEKLAASVEKYWIKFSNIVGSENYDSIYFLEGSDDQQFYFTRSFRYNAFLKIFPVNCGGKKEVISAFEEVMPKYGEYYPGKKLPIPLFFVDRDLDPYLSDPQHQSKHLFETKHYSFENYLCTSSVFSLVCQTYFSRKVDSDYIITMQRFEKSLLNYTYTCALISAAAIYLRRNNGVLVSNDINIDRLLKTSYDHNTTKFDTTELKKIISKIRTRNTALQFSIKKIKPVIEELKNEHPLTISRGKWVLGFMIKYLNHVKAKFQAQRAGGPVSSLPIDSAIPILSEKAECIDVDAFIRQHFSL